jgi:hypothetical protein
VAASQTVIRVNLRFGPRTDPKLLQALFDLAPADRAGWVRAWITEGWRRYHGQIALSPGPLPKSVASLPSEGAPSLQTVTSAQDPVNSLEDGIAAFLGQRIV